jgi:RimJ/RimL family protein N-acetyltransferase
VIPRLRGPRLDLRPLADGDEALYVRVYGDPEVMRHIGTPQDAATAARGFRAALRHNASTPPVRLFWVIHDRILVQELGLIGLSLDEPGGAEVGVALPAAHQGRGVATEAIATLAGHAFVAMRLQRLHTRHRAGHGLAAGLMASLGFERTTPDAAGAQWRWQLTPAGWAASPRRQAMANPLP